MFTVPAIIDEIKAAELLLQSRKQVKSLADSLCTSLVSKIQGLGQAICAANLVGLYDAVTASSLDDRFKETLNKALDELAVAGGTQLATKTQMAPQKIDSFHCYLTPSNWKLLEAQSMWQSTVVVATRLRKLGVVSLRESSKKWITGLLVQLDMNKTGEMQPYLAIYQLSQQVLQAFTSCNEVVPPGVPSLLAYPNSPLELGEAVLKASYGDEMPEPRDMPGLAMLVAHHIKVRSSSSLLQKGQAMPTPSASSGTKQKESELQPDSQPDPTSKAMVALADWFMRSSMIFSHAAPPPGCNIEFLKGSQARTATAETPQTAVVPAPALTPPVPEQSVDKNASVVVAKKESTVLLPEEQPKESGTGSKTLEDWNRAAFEALKEKKEKNGSTKKAQAKAKPKAKAKAKGKAAKSGSLKKKTASKAGVASGRSSSSTTFGCIRCRGNPKGCDTCWRPTFNGKRFKSRDEWKQWAALNGKK